MDNNNEIPITVQHYNMNINMEHIIKIPSLLSLYKNNKPLSLSVNPHIFINLIDFLNNGSCNRSTSFIKLLDKLSINYTIKDNTIILDTSCPICFNDINKDDLYILNCYHYFHSQCIIQWKEHHNNCPICRQPNIQKYIHKSIINKYIEEIDTLRNDNKGHINQIDVLNSTINKLRNKIDIMKSNMIVNPDTYKLEESITNHNVRLGSLIQYNIRSSNSMVNDFKLVIKFDKRYEALDNIDPFKLIQYISFHIKDIPSYNITGSFLRSYYKLKGIDIYQDSNIICIPINFTVLEYIPLNCIYEFDIFVGFNDEYFIMDNPIHNILFESTLIYNTNKDITKDIINGYHLSYGTIIYNGFGFRFNIKSDYDIQYLIINVNSIEDEVPIVNNISVSNGCQYIYRQHIVGNNDNDSYFINLNTSSYNSSEGYHDLDVIMDIDNVNDSTTIICYCISTFDVSTRYNKLVIS
jgi:hypothetical protein